MTEARYDLAGALLLVTGDEPRLFAAFDTMLRSLATQSPAAPTFRIDIRLGDPEPAVGGGQIIYDGPVPEDGHCVMRRDGDATHLVFPGLQSLSLLPAESRAEIRVSPDAEGANWTVWMMALDAAIDATGQSLIHAAGLTLPGQDAAILVHAPSGAGKTTAALALASAGFGLLSDDGVVAGLRGAAWSGWGLPRAVKIHSRTAAMLPLFGAALLPEWDRNGEQAVPLARLRNIIRVEEPSPRELVGLFQLERAANGISSVAPMRRADTLASLAADNVRTGRTGLLPIQKRRMNALAGLVSSAPLFRLESGTDLENLGPLVLSALGVQDLGVQGPGVQELGAPQG